MQFWVDSVLLIECNIPVIHSYDHIFVCLCNIILIILQVMANLTGIVESPQKIEIWEKLYSEKKDIWSVPIVNTVVAKEVYDKFTGGRKNLDIFLPLCGRSPDMIWLVSQGHRVTGVEWLESVIQQFFTENNLEYEIKTDVNVGKDKSLVYSAKTIPITIYCCDMFSVTSEVVDKFDCILDVGSMASQPPVVYNEYSAICRTMLKPKGSILLSTFNFDQPLRKHPPFACPLEEIQNTYGVEFDVVLAQKEGSEKVKEYLGNEVFDPDSVPKFEWNFHLMTKKN